jgi:hypothetical protein
MAAPVEAIPPEDYGKDSDSKTCDEARFQYHRSDNPLRPDRGWALTAQKVDGLNKATDNRQAEDVARQQQ